MSKPDFYYEEQYSGIVAGVDEVGRGPLSGPVFAAIVIINKENFIDGINDSKKISYAKRVKLHSEITEKYKYAVGKASVEEIDKYNILNATKLAMKRAIESLNKEVKLDRILVDGNQTPQEIGIPITSVVGGDSLSISIAAASIVAKVVRDRTMEDLHHKFPIYNWQKNKGYGTKEHLSAIQNHGFTEHHRKTFVPMKNMLEIL